MNKTRKEFLMKIETEKQLNCKAATDPDVQKTCKHFGASFYSVSSNKIKCKHLAGKSCVYHLTKKGKI